MKLTASVTLTRQIQGPQGRNGRPMRTRLWDEIADGETLTSGYDDGDIFTDVVIEMQTFTPPPGTSQPATQKPICYLCVTRCSKVAGTSPGSLTYSGKLMEAAQFQIIATGLILASNAVITLIQGNKIMLGPSGSVGMQYDSRDLVRIWAGGTTPSSANYRVYEDGSVFANNGTFRGTIQARTLDLSESTVSSGIPNGAICVDIDNVTLPALSPGQVRNLKIVSPFSTKLAAGDLVLTPQDTSVNIRNETMTVGTYQNTAMTLSGCGSNSGKGYDLLGFRSGNATYWIVTQMF